MSSKGVSPMIAVVLLIAFTITVGGIMSVWLTGYATTTQEAVENTTTDHVKCSGTYIDIISVTSSGVIITNRGSETITNPVCYWGNGSLLDNFGASLDSGGSNSSAFGHENGPTSLLCTGSCRSIGITGECKSGQSCWKT
jgi:flagellin-like protein